MLWLAGLMGLVGMGAASIAVVQLQQPDDDEDDFIDHDPDVDDAGNLLDHVSAYGAPAAPATDQRFSDSEEDAILYDTITDDDMLYAEGGSGFDVPGDDTAQDDVAPFAPMPPEPPVAFERTVEEMPLAGDWITQAETPEIIDYTARDEQLVLVWDDMTEGAAEPEVAVSADPDDPDVVHVEMNGAPLAEIHGEPGLTLADIALVALSSALIAGLKPSQKQQPIPLIERD